MPEEKNSRYGTHSSHVNTCPCKHHAISCPFFCRPDGPVALDGEGDGDVDGATEEGAAHRVEERVSDHVEELAAGKVVDARGVDQGEGDEAVVQDHQRRKQPVEDALQLLAAKKKQGCVISVPDTKWKT